MQIAGTITDAATGKPVVNAYWQESYYDDSSGNISPFGNKYPAPGGNYNIDFDALGLSGLSANHYFVFSAPGYEIYYANDISLNDTPNVLLPKSAGILSSSAGGILAVGAGLFLLASQNKKKHEIGKLETKDVFPYLLIGGAVLALGLVKKITDAFGLTSSADQQAVNNYSNTPGSFWNSDFWQEFTSWPDSVLVNNDSAASQLWIALDNSWGVMVPNFDNVFAIFKTMKSQSDLSYFSYYVKSNEGEDLLGYLQGFSWTETRLSASQIVQISNYITQLPTH